MCRQMPVFIWSPVAEDADDRVPCADRRRESQREAKQTPRERNKRRAR